jgi:hypothetical protein
MQGKKKNGLASRAVNTPLLKLKFKKNKFLYTRYYQMLLDLLCNRNKSLITADDGTLEFCDVNSKQIRISYMKYIKKNCGLHEITYKEQYRAT